MDKPKAAASEDEPLVQKAKDAQQHALDLAQQKQFSIDPVTTELHDLAMPPPCTPTNVNEVTAFMAKCKQDAMEVRLAINEALRLGDEAEQFTEKAISEAAGIPYFPPDPSEQQFYPDQLYGPNEPSSKDAKQDRLGDCTVVATMATMADNTPDAIKKMIQYNPMTGNYDVTFTNPDGTTKKITLTDLRADIAVQGGSRVDNGDGKAPTWPAVLETAYAKTMPPTDESKLSDEQRKQLNILKAYSPEYGETFFRISQGGSGPVSLSALTGKPVTSYNSADALKPENVAAVQQAIANHQPILFGTTSVPADDQYHNYQLNWDGIPNGHAMQVQEIHVDPNTHHVIATVRNPWSDNQGTDHGVPEPGGELTIDVTELQQQGACPPSTWRGSSGS